MTTNDNDLHTLQAMYKLLNNVVDLAKKSRLNSIQLLTQYKILKKLLTYLNEQQPDVIMI